jgi:hypothetical protein
MIELLCWKYLIVELIVLQRRIGIAPIEKFMSGIKRGAEYFDCEKPHSRYHTIKKLAKFFSEQNKNYE